MRRETLRSLGCIAAGLLGYAINRDEPWRVGVGVILFCIITIIYDCIGTRDRPPTPTEAEAQAKALRYQEMKAWLENSRDSYRPPYKRKP